MSLIRAEAEIWPNQHGITGKITFEQVDKIKTLIRGTVYGLTPGLHGFHIHTEGAKALSCIKNKNSSSCCDLLGGHFNPFNQNHGYPHSIERHVGDLGNIYVNERGIGHVQLQDTMIKLSGPPELSILGRSIIIHADPDDGGYGGYHDSKETGHSGARIACGIIKRVK